jgi:DNA-binding CsgD family transcriptional regulator
MTLSTAKRNAAAHEGAGGVAGRHTFAARPRHGSHGPPRGAVTARPAGPDATPAGSWSLTGRDAERQILMDAVTADAHSVVISGAAGLGRTRLAREALALAREAGRGTRWAAGTSAAAGVPLGALAHLIPPAETASDPFTLLQRAMSALIAGGGDRPLAVAIDDAHLLDQLSLTLVQQLVTSRSVTFVITMRPGGPVAGQLAKLWMDGAATRLELQPLGRQESDLLVAAALAGDVDTRTGERLWRLSCGYPLFLRELVEGGRAAGHLRQRDGLWRWDGEIRLTPRLVEIVLAQLDGADPAERAALEVIAAGEPLGLDRLVGLSTSEAVAALERRGLVAVDRTGRHAEARVAHPLYAEVVRDQMPEATASLIRRQLGRGPARRPSHGELLRISRLALESEDADLDVEVVTEAAGHAIAVLDHRLAERLARAGVDAGAGVAARLALLESLQWQGRHAEAERVGADAAGLVASIGTPDAEQTCAQLGMMRATNLFYGSGRATEAEAVLATAGEAVTDDGARAVLQATRALLAFRSGWPQRAVELGSGVLADPNSGPGARPLAAAAVACGLAVIGRTSEALAAADTGWVALEEVPAAPGTAFARLVLAHGELLALRSAGRIPELERRAEELHRRSMTAPEWAGDAVAALHVGSAALETGRLRGATRWLAEGLTGLTRHDPLGLLPVCAAQLAQAHALLGDGAAAEELLLGPGSVRGPATVVFEPQLLLAQAWQAAGEGGRPVAAARAQEAADVAADRGQWAVEAAMLHGAVQLGRAREVAPRLRRLAERLDGPLAALYAEHADARAAGSGHRLDAVATAFEDLGALLPAADAAAAAALAHQRAEARREASTSTVRATRLSRACNDPRTPALEQLTPPRLTSREEEVALLAADGLNNHDIAARLVLSVRTVETHLAHVFTKLGIRRRAQLGDAIASGTPAPGARPDRRGYAVPLPRASAVTRPAAPFRGRA